MFPSILISDLEFTATETLVDTCDMNVYFGRPDSNISMSSNETLLTDKIYVYSPLGRYASFVLLLLLVTVGIAGFLGNTLFIFFLKSGKKTPVSFLKVCSFQRNFAVYLKSLAISDVFSSLISVPLLCFELYLDLFHSGWSCKCIRYLTILFPCITMNNLLLISVERYLSTRKNPRTFRLSTVRKMVIFAWVAGGLIVLFPALTYDGLRFDLNQKHYTIVCRFNQQHLPFRIIILSFVALQYIIPTIIIVKIHLSLIRTVWRVRTVRKTAVDVQRDNGIRMKYRAATIRSTWIIIALTFAFIIPYIAYFAQVAYNHITKASINFKTDFTIRIVSGLIAMANATVNFALYLVQLPDFRSYVKKRILKYPLAKRTSQKVELINVDIQLLRFSTFTYTLTHLAKQIDKSSKYQSCERREQEHA